MIMLKSYHYYLRPMLQIDVNDGDDDVDDDDGSKLFDFISPTATSRNLHKIVHVLHINSKHSNIKIKTANGRRG